MKIWVDKKPQNCDNCPFSNSIIASDVMGKSTLGHYCKVLNDIVYSIKRCPLQEVEQIDNKTIAIPTPNGKIIKRIQGD